MPYADRERQRAASRESARRRRAARRGVTGATNAAKGATRGRVEPSHPARQAGAGFTPADLAQILAEEIAIVRESMPRGSHERPRIVAQLAAVALRCFEVNDLSGRVEELEHALEALGDRRGALHVA